MGAPPPLKSRKLGRTLRSRIAPLLFEEGRIEDGAAADHADAWRAKCAVAACRVEAVDQDEAVADLEEREEIDEAADMGEREGHAEAIARDDLVAGDEAGGGAGDAVVGMECALGPRGRTGGVVDPADGMGVGGRGGQAGRDRRRQVGELGQAGEQLEVMRRLSSLTAASSSSSRSARDEQELRPRLIQTEGDLALAIDRDDRILDQRRAARARPSARRSRSESAVARTHAGPADAKGEEAGGRALRCRAVGREADLRERARRSA